MSATIDYIQRSSNPTNVNSVEFNKICEWLDNLPLLATQEKKDLDVAPNLVGSGGKVQNGKTYEDIIKIKDEYCVCYPCADRVIFIEGTKKDLLSHNKHTIYNRHPDYLIYLMIATGILTKNRKWR